MLDRLESGHAQAGEHEGISCPLVHLLDRNITANGYGTAGHHITPSPEPHGIGNCYGRRCLAQGSGDMFAGEVTHQGFVSGSGPVEVFGIGSQLADRLWGDDLLGFLFSSTLASGCSFRIYKHQLFFYTEDIL